MNKTEYDHPVLRQCRLTPGIVKTVLDVMDYDKLVDVLPIKELCDAQQIVLLASGPELPAGIAAKAIFESVVKMDVRVATTLEFSRFINSKELGFAPNTPLVVALSITGDEARMTESILRANRYGANTLLITNSPDSPAASNAKHVLTLQLPEGDCSQGACALTALMTALTAMMLRFARARNKATMQQMTAMEQGLRQYADDWQALLPQMEEQAVQLAQSWKGLRAYDLIGDYADFATALAGRDRIAECTGAHAVCSDSEDWCHVNYYLSQPEQIGRAAVANSDTPSYGRVKETLQAVTDLQSPCVVISDRDGHEFPKGCQVFTAPKPSHFWMAPLLQHLPLGLMAGYMAALTHETPLNPKEMGFHPVKDSQIQII